MAPADNRGTAAAFAADNRGTAADNPEIVAAAFAADNRGIVVAAFAADNPEIAVAAAAFVAAPAVAADDSGGVAELPER